MAIQEMELDPNAAAYTDDEIVGKVNAATDKVTRADSVEIVAILESATEKLMSADEKTKLTSIEDNAKDDQTGAEIQTAVLGLADADRKLIKTDPQSNEFTVLALQRKSTGNLGIKYDDVAIV